MTFTHTELRALPDDELARAIERLHERIMELDRDLGALKLERDKRAHERRRREIEANEGGLDDEL
jgi:hypothetical protein